MDLLLPAIFGLVVGLIVSAIPGQSRLSRVLACSVLGLAVVFVVGQWIPPMRRANYKGTSYAAILGIVCGILMGMCLLAWMASHVAAIARSRRETPAEHDDDEHELLSRDNSHITH